jgi:hypothetical protein
MIKTGTLVASALIAIVSFSAPSFAQSRSVEHRGGSPALSSSDVEQQRLNDIRQQTSDSGFNTIDHPEDRTPWGVAAGASQDRQMQGLYGDQN